MEKINPLQTFEKDETDLRHLQLIYLYDNNFSQEEIARWTGYAVKTIKNYVRKFANLLEEAKKVFKRITKKAKIALRGAKQLCYLYKFYNSNNQLICSKVGTTTRLPEDRLKEEITYYKKNNIPIETAKICSVIDCGELPAEGAESITRALFIRKYPNAFCKNDRFFGVDIPTQTFNKIVKEYLTGRGYFNRAPTFFLFYLLTFCLACVIIIMKGEDKMNKAKVIELMKKLDCTEAEALELLAEDEQIDKMTVAEAQSDLSEEQKKAIKKATITGSKKRTAVKRERKIDEIKKRFINGIKTYLEGCGAIVEQPKNETDLHFSFNNEEYSIKLTKHRPPKK